MRADTITRHTVDPARVAAIEARQARRVVTTRELMDRYLVVRATVYRWARTGIIERTGRGLYYDPDERA